jgi:prepilin-type N-terminal cleavage/methylation domain-containing protein
MQTPSSRIARFTRGFTMTEMMVALTILGLTMSGVVAFTFQSLNVFAYDSGRLLVNHDMRRFTGDMITDAVYASYFQIYPSFTSRGGTRADGGTGDFLLLVTTQVMSTGTSAGTTMVTKLVGYYRDGDATTPGKVHKVIYDWGDAAHGVVIGAATNTTLTPAVYTMPDLLDAYVPTSAASANPVVIQLAEGLANGNMFYNFKDHSVMIRAQINEEGKMLRRAVNTYNFTVSPRG